MSYSTATLLSRVSLSIVQALLWQWRLWPLETLNLKSYVVGVALKKKKSGQISYDTLTTFGGPGSATLGSIVHKAIIKDDQFIINCMFWQRLVTRCKWSCDPLLGPSSPDENPQQNRQSPCGLNLFADWQAEYQRCSNICSLYVVCVFGPEIIHVRISW